MYTFTTQECTFFDAKSTYSCIKGNAKGSERVNSVKIKREIRNIMYHLCSFHLLTNKKTAYFIYA